jgi:hypothetical protein
MRLQIHQYYGTFGFPLAIVTEKTYKDFQGRSADGIESPTRQPNREDLAPQPAIVRRLMCFYSIMDPEFSGVCGNFIGG